jgi:glucose-6-phosphate isomerase
MAPDTEVPLAAAAQRLRATRLTELFARDPRRAQALAFAWNDWYVDLAKERIDAPTFAALLDHARSTNLEQWIRALFAGEKINLSEGRPVLHPMLRQPTIRSLVVDGVDVGAQMRDARERATRLAAELRAGRRMGATGRPLRALVNLGIGGSDLGPRLVCDALAGPGGDTGQVAVSFVSNVDPAHLARTLAVHDPATTLFVVTSKTFTTQETLANAQAARAWLHAAMPAADLAPHFVAVSSNVAAARAFGVRDEDILPMPEGVGGRYSLWSAVGVSIAVAAGVESFVELLAGAHAMDEHFASTPFERNLPVVLGVLGWWQARWLARPQRVVVPYAHALAYLPAYLQQLVLESNGKSVTRDGQPLEGPTSPALWGSTGTDGQHAFFQWLHQGTHEVPVEFIVPVRARHPIANQQTLLVANALAQAQALLVGRDDDTIRGELAGSGLAGPALDEAIAARRCPGNRPSTTLLLPVLDARNLGALLALYEHRTFVEGVLFGINSFDQWGVELGKSLAKPLVRALEDGASLPAGTDASTLGLTAAVTGLMRSRS